jgi:hypothetical protein
VNLYKKFYFIGWQLKSLSNWIWFPTPGAIAGYSFKTRYIKVGKFPFVITSADGKIVYIIAQRCYQHFKLVQVATIFVYLLYLLFA